jgi:AcrR family transcriptional regulator
MRSPADVQAFLDGAAYSADPFYRCPLRVLRERVAHCFDGALFAAAMLRRLGHRPLILDLLPNERDDDHLLALFKVDGFWGAVAKSNFAGLRYREPIHRTLRELVLSYFEPFYNVEREKTLRAYTRPLNLRGFDRLAWTVRDEPLEAIAARLDAIPRTRLLTPAMESGLAAIDERSYRAGLMGANERGLWRPPEATSPSGGNRSE